MSTQAVCAQRKVKKEKKNKVPKLPKKPTGRYQPNRKYKALELDSIVYVKPQEVMCETENISPEPTYTDNVFPEMNVAEISMVDLFGKDEINYLDYFQSSGVQIDACDSYYPSAEKYFDFDALDILENELNEEC